MIEQQDFLTCMLEETAQELADQIDKDIIWEMLYKDRYPYTVEISMIELHERIDWLNESFEIQTWAEHRGRLYFKNQQDFVLYILSWA